MRRFGASRVTSAIQERTLGYELGIISYGLVMSELPRISAIVVLHVVRIKVFSYTFVPSPPDIAIAISAIVEL